MTCKSCLFVIGLMALTGCSQISDLDNTPSDRVKNAGYPGFLPLNQLLTAAPPIATDASLAQVQGRVGALEARAAMLQRRPISRQSDVQSRLSALRARAARLRTQ